MHSVRCHFAIILGLLVTSVATFSAGAEPADKSARFDSLGDPLPPHALARFGTTRWRQHWSITRLSYSSDGKLLAAQSYEEGFCLWDAITGKRLAHLPIEDSYRRAIAFSGDGRWLALANKEGTSVHLHDATTGKERNATKVGFMIALALSPNGKHLAVLSREGQQPPGVFRMLEQDPSVVVHLLDTEMGAEVRKLKCAASTLAFSMDGKTLLTGDDKRLRVWDVSTGKELRRIEGPAKEFALSADGRTLATRVRPFVHVFDLATGARQHSIPTPDEELNTGYDKLALSSDGTTVALAGHGFLFAWDTRTGKERFRRLGAFWATAVAFAPGGQTLTWSCMYAPLMHRWDLAADKEVEPYPGHGNWVQSVAFTPNGKTLITGSNDLTVRFWSVDHAGSRAARPPLSIVDTSTLSIILGGRGACSRDGKLLALPGPDKDVSLVEAESGTVIRKLTGSTGCSCLAFSPNGQLVAGGDSYHGKSSNPQGRVYVWEAATGKMVHMIEGLGGTVRAVAFAPDGQTLASSSDGVRLWNVSNGQQVRRFPHRGAIDAIAFSPDGRTLAAGGAGAVVWELDTRKELHRLAGGGQVPAVAISPDGKLVATGGHDKMVRLWNLASGEELIQLAGHSGRVHTLAFSADGKQLASGSEDTTVLLWDVDAARAAARK